VEQGVGGAEHLVPLLRSDRSEVADPVVVEVGADLGGEVVLVLDDAGEHERPPRPPGHLDGLRGPLVGVDAAEDTRGAVELPAPTGTSATGMPWCTVAA
jgi:hypothetical protein